MRRTNLRTHSARAAVNVRRQAAARQLGPHGCTRPPSRSTLCAQMLPETPALPRSTSTQHGTSPAGEQAPRRMSLLLALGRLLAAVGGRLRAKSCPPLSGAYWQGERMAA